MADDIKKFIEEKTEETKRHFDVVIEDLEKGTLKAVNEQLDGQSKQLARLADVPEKLDKIDMRLAALETTLEAVNLPMLKQKVIGLEKRVEILESKLRLA